MATHEGKKTPIFSDDMTKKDKRTAKACMFAMVIGSYLCGMIAWLADNTTMCLVCILLWFSTVFPIYIGAKNGLIIAKRKNDE